MQDRVALAPLLDLLLGAVLLGVGHRVAAEAVGDGLDEGGPPLVAGHAQGLGDHGVRVDDVHAVAPHAGHAEGLALGPQVGDRRVALQRRAHPELVVDHQEDDRQLPQGGEVHGLAEGALVAGAVAKHAQHGVLGLSVIAGEGDARCQRQVPAHDPVAAEEAAFVVEEVHRAAPSLGAAVHAPEQLGHHGVR